MSAALAEAPTAARATARSLSVVVPAARLLDTLRRVDKVVPVPRPAAPVMAGVVLTASPGGFTVSRTDFDATYSEAVEAPGATGSALLPFRQLRDLLSAIGRGNDVVLTATGDTAALTAGTPDGVVTYRFATIPMDDYPAPNSSAATFEHVGDLQPGDLAALQRVTTAASADDTLPILCGVHLTSGTEGGAVEAHATDRFRLACQTLTMTTSGPLDALVETRHVRGAGAVFTKDPTVGVSVARRVPSKHDPETGPTAEYTRFATGGRSLTVRAVAGTYPKVASLVPTDATARYSGPADVLARQVRRAAVGVPRGFPVRLDNCPDGLHLYASTGRGGDENTTDGDVDVTVTGITAHEPVPVAFNPGFLRDALAGFKDSAVILASDGPTRPTLITSADHPGYRVLLMPVRNPT